MKIKDNVFQIFQQSIKLYFNNFGSFFKYMAFPVFGQILGLFLVLFMTFLYTQNLPKFVENEIILNNFSLVFLILLILIIPGFLIFAKAFWDYLVAYGAINSMVDNMIKSGKVYDFPAHTEVIIRKTAKFVSLWLLIGLMAIIGLFPLFWVIAIIIFVYLILVFQVFTFEPDKSVFGCLQKSANLIKGNFGRTFGLMLLIGGLTYCILPFLVQLVFDFLFIISFLASLVDSWTMQLPVSEVNQIFIELHSDLKISSLMIAKYIVKNTLVYIIICFTLPLRSICWALWYKALNKGEVKLDKKILDRAEGKK